MVWSRLRKVVKAAAGGDTVADAELFSELLLADADPAELSRYDESLLAEIVSGAYGFLAEKPVGRHKLRFRHIGSPVAATLVEILNDDMPFLVDSVMAEIQVRDIPVRLVLHPIFKTERRADGRLQAVTAPGDRNWREHQESFIQVHLEPRSDRDAEALVAELSGILDDVRAAVRDWKPMLDRLGNLITDYETAPPPVPADELQESIAFMRWLIEGNFTFLGMREMALSGGVDGGDLQPRSGTGLGILANPDVRVLRRGQEFVHMTPEIRRFFFAPAVLIIAKANTVSRVHRRVHMDYVGAKIYGRDGKPEGELRLVGLFTSAAYTRSVGTIPLLRHKVSKVVAGLGHPADSHSGKAVVNVLETFPRDELFQIRAELLQEWVDGILDLELRPRARVFARVDEFDRFVSVLCFVPRERFSSEVRQRLADLFCQSFGGRLAAFTPYFMDTRLVRIQYIVAIEEGKVPSVDAAALEREAALIVQSWQDRLNAEIAASADLKDKPGLAAKYGDAFSAGYREIFSPARALQDIARLEQLSDDNPVGIDFYRDDEAPPSRVRVAVYRLGDPIPLSDRVPLFENLGFRVIDERSYRVSPRFDGMQRNVRLHDMVLEEADGKELKLGEDDLRLEACYLAIWRGETANDSYNRLIKAAGLDWRGASLARAAGAYLNQLGAPFSQQYLADTLVRYAAVTADLAALFAVRFDPDNGLSMAERAEREREIRGRIEAAIAKVESLDEDRILRLFLSLILATKRTNAYQLEANGERKPTIAFKLASREVEGMPEPRPFAEIWVYSPRVEGVHLRMAPIARGGLRWSDRAQDFRTEVLGLVKAQQVKNTVIVPEGAKGGFHPKQLPPREAREAYQQEGIAAYKLFVSSLLDLTDNLRDGKVVPPERVVRHDGDDPYLVVAADKGTATFSDIANELSIRRGFWLGDAFASGGSAGYDHKKMGITARGGWECVKRHFREMDVDIQARPFTVIGIGDMSGDVFGNAMLLSTQIRLIAAFDHRHIFIDPDPDPAVSYAERKRLFELPRSSWEDYDKSKLSKGGGVYSRASKSIALSAEARAVLDIEEETLTPQALMRAVLKCRANLLWFGGIGTYVRASDETDEQVGDRANDQLRITARDMRVKVVGEGANLGMTQRARIEFGMLGGRSNTDFIDNSAGVNSSDQEVNIKIAFGPLVAAGRLSIEERNRILVGMTEEVAAACLRNNYLQSLAISLGQQRGLADLGFQQRLIRELEATGRLDRQLEMLPSDTEIATRMQSGVPLTRAELAVLLSYAKIDLSHRLIDSGLPDDPYLRATLHAYFPKVMRERFAEAIDQHRLRRAIIVSTLTNQVINRGGSTMVVRLEEETGHSAAGIVEAFTAVVAVFDLERIWSEIDALDNIVTGALQLELYRETQDLLRRQAAWFLRHGKLQQGLSKVIGDYRRGVEAFGEALERVMPVKRRRQFYEHKDRYMSGGVPEGLAGAIAMLDFLSEGVDVTAVALATERSMADVANVHCLIGDHFRLGELKTAADNLHLTEYFDRIAVNSTINSLADAQRAITQAIAREGAGDPAAGVRQWLERCGASAVRAKASIDEIVDGGALTLARLTVAASQMRDLVAE